MSRAGLPTARSTGQPTADHREVFGHDLLRTFCEITGIRNAFTSFDYLQRGEREGLEPDAAPTLVSV